jgi:hypothetical protein
MGEVRASAAEPAELVWIISNSSSRPEAPAVFYAAVLHQLRKPVGGLRVAAMSQGGGRSHRGPPDPGRGPRSATRPLSKFIWMPPAITDRYSPKASAGLAVRPLNPVGGQAAVGPACIWCNA